MNRILRNFEVFLTNFKRAERGIKRRVGFLLGTGGLVVVFALWSIASILSVQSEPSPAKEELRVEDYMSTPRRELTDYTQTVEIKNIGVQLMSHESEEMSTAQFTLILDCPTEEAHKVLSIQRPKVLDAVFDVANGLTLEQASGAMGMERFKAKLLASLEKKFKENAPRRIDVKDWTVQ